MIVDVASRFCGSSGERPWRERLLARYVSVVVSRLRMIGEEMRGRPLGRLTYHVLGSMDIWRIPGGKDGDVAGF